MTDSTFDRTQLPRRIVCWPVEWLDAVVKSGLAEKTSEGSYRIHGGDEMREKLQIFASELLGVEDGCHD